MQINDTKKKEEMDLHERDSNILQRLSGRLILFFATLSHIISMRNSHILSFAFLSICFLITSCLESNRPKDIKVMAVKLPYYIDIESNISSYKKVNLSEIADSIEYVTIETTPLCLLKSAWNVKLSSNFIFVSDFNGIYKFGRNGKFTCRIGRQGKGPGEYINVKTFTIDATKELVFVVDNWTDFINIYDFDGKFVKSVRYDFDLLNIAICNDSTLAYSRTCNGAEINEHNLMIIDYNTGDVKNKYKDFYNIKGPHSFDFTTLINCNNQMYFNDTFCDTMFVIDEQMKQMPFCVFHFGKYKILDTHSQMAKVSFVERIILIKDNILFRYMSPLKDNFLRTSMYNISTNQLVNVIPFENQTFDGIGGFYNDFDGIVPFWPKFVGENGELIYYLESYKLKEIEELSLKYNGSKEYKNEKNYTYIKTALAANNLNDNGILMIVYPKKY